MSPLRKRITVRSGHILGHFDSVELAADFAQRIGSAKTVQLPHDEATALPEIDFSAEAKSVINCATMCVHYFGAPTVAKGFQKYKLPSLLHRSVRELDAASSLLRHPGASLKVLAALKSWLATEPQPRPDYNESLITSKTSGNDGDPGGLGEARPMSMSPSATSKFRGDYGGGGCSLCLSASATPRLSGSGEDRGGRGEARPLSMSLLATSKISGGRGGEDCSLSSTASATSKLPGNGEDLGRPSDARPKSISPSATSTLCAGCGGGGCSLCSSASATSKLSGSGEDLGGPGDAQPMSMSQSATSKFGGDSGGEDRTLLSSASATPKLSGGDGEGLGGLGDARPLSISPSATSKFGGDSGGEDRTLHSTASATSKLSGGNGKDLGGPRDARPMSMSPTTTSKICGGCGGGGCSSCSSASAFPKLSGNGEDLDGPGDAQPLSISLSATSKLGGDSGGEDRPLPSTASATSKLSGGNSEDLSGPSKARPMSMSPTATSKICGGCGGGGCSLCSSASATPKLSGNGEDLGGLGDARPMSISPSDTSKFRGGSGGEDRSLCSTASATSKIPGNGEDLGQLCNASPTSMSPSTSSTFCVGCGGGGGGCSLCSSASATSKLSGGNGEDLGGLCNARPMAMSPSATSRICDGCGGGGCSLCSSASATSKLSGNDEDIGGLGVGGIQGGPTAGDFLQRLCALEQAMLTFSSQIIAHCSSLIENMTATSSDRVRIEVEGVASAFTPKLEFISDLLHSEVARVHVNTTELVATRFDELSYRLDLLTSKLTESVTDRCNVLSKRIDSLAVESLPPPNVADCYLGQDCSWDEAGEDPHSLSETIEIRQQQAWFRKENLASHTPHQILLIDKSKTVEEGMKVLERAMTSCSFHLKGHCKFGERCAFRHDEVDTASTEFFPMDAGEEKIELRIGDTVEAEKPGQDCDSEGGEIVCGGSSGRDRPDREIEELRLSFVGLTKKEIQDEIDEWRLTFTAQGISKNEIKQETEYQALLLELASRREKKKKKKKVDTAGTDFFPMDAGEEKNELRIGDTVEVHGLKTAKRLNGSRGVVTSINDDMRYGVLLYGDTESKAIKLENLEKLSSMGS